MINSDGISVVIPVLNEESNLPFLYKKLKDVLLAQSLPYELIFVDDGSTDKSMSVINSLHAQDPNVKLLSFSRNFGHQAALSAGMDFSTGKAVLFMDADLQHPPELISELIRKWQE